jgi:hypothetical protein
MASEVDISNNALGYLGDSANVVSLSPPSGSVQAVHCARFYPLARDELLEMHPWGFAMRRIQLALLTETAPTPWTYTYAVPAGALNLLSITDPDALDDYSVGVNNVGNYTPQNFVTESDATGAQVIYTNQQNAMLRYSARVTDTTQFSPLFTAGLTRLLASKLAGPVLKGAEGRAEAKAQLATFAQWFALATLSDANQQRTRPTQRVGWIAAR